MQLAIEDFFERKMTDTRPIAVVKGKYPNGKFSFALRRELRDRNKKQTVETRTFMQCACYNNNSHQ